MLAVGVSSKNWQSICALLGFTPKASIQRPFGSGRNNNHATKVYRLFDGGVLIPSATSNDDSRAAGCNQFP